MNLKLAYFLAYCHHYLLSYIYLRMDNKLKFNLTYANCLKALLSPTSGEVLFRGASSGQLVSAVSLSAFNLFFCNCRKDSTKASCQNSIRHQSGCALKKVNMYSR